VDNNSAVESKGVENKRPTSLISDVRIHWESSSSSLPLSSSRRTISKSSASRVTNDSDSDYEESECATITTVKTKNLNAKKVKASRVLSFPDKLYDILSCGKVN